MKNNIRFRRMDEHNFVIEKWQQPKIEDRKVDGWRVLGHYGSIASMLKDAVNVGAWGNSCKELADAVQNQTSSLLEAFDRAVQSGALVVDEATKSEMTRRRLETRRRNGAQKA